MRKKFTMLLASLFLCMGTAWAQVLTTAIEVGKEYTLQCKATDHKGFINDNGTDISGRGETPTNLVFEVSDTEGYYYLKSTVSGKYINYDGTNVSASEEKSTIWTVNTYSHTANTVSLSASGYTDKYLNNNATNSGNGVSGLKMNGHTGGPGAGNTCSLWSLREAVPEVVSGKVYKITNKANANKVISETSDFMLGTSTTTTSDDDKSQLWYVEGSNVEGYTFRNLNTGDYANYVDAHYTHWATTDTPVRFYLTQVEKAAAETPNYYAITFNDKAALGDYAYMHYSDGYIVRWQVHDSENNVGASLWKFEEVSINGSEKLNESYTNWKGDITAKIEEAEELLSNTGFGVTQVALSTDNTTCPAAISDNSDGDGVPALLDDDNSTFMHTKYSGKGSVGEPHYIQVDLGESNSAKYITFSYRARHNTQNNNPETIIIKGSVDGNGYTDIQTLTNLPDGLIEYESPVVGNGTAYRYFRFVVTETTNMATHEGYVFFSLSKFRMNTVTVNDDYVGKAAVLDNMSEWINTHEIAEERPEDWCLKTYSEWNAEISELIYGATLREYPFTLTTDVNAPVCYQILSGRATQNNGTPHYFTLKPNDGGKVKLETTTRNNVYSYWFFMEDPETGMLIVVPFMDASNPLGYLTVSNGNSKLTNVHSTSEFAGYHYELIEYSGVEGFPYALRPYGTETNVSNHGGTGNFMGFYDGSADAGTSIKFEAVNRPALEFRNLPAAIESANNNCPGADRTGEMLNGYSTESVNNYKAAVTEAGELYNTASTTAEAINEQIETLSNLYSVLEINLPKAGNFYRVRCSDGNKRILSTLVEKTEIDMRLKMENTVTGESIFFYDGNSLLSYTTGLHINAYRFNDVGETSNVTFSKAYNKVLGCYNINIANRYIYGSNNYLDSGSGDNPDQRNGYNWWLEEVTTLPVAVSDAGYATLYAPVALQIPDGVTAYIGVQEDNYLALTDIKTVISEGIIPANTGVVLEADAQTYNFTVATGEYTLESADNLLTGAYPKSEKNADKKVYTLQNGANGVGFYLFKGYSDENDQAGTKTYINGFRAWVELDSADPAQALALRFGRGEGGTTAIDNAQLTMDNGQLTIYDLQGRRVLTPTKGMYIVNGKKIVIK